jgi:hypothetical protein
MLGLGICICIDYIFIIYYVVTHVNPSRGRQIIKKNVDIDRN